MRRKAPASYHRFEKDDLGLEEIEAEPPTSNVVRRRFWFRAPFKGAYGF